MKVLPAHKIHYWTENGISPKNKEFIYVCVKVPLTHYNIPEVGYSFYSQPKIINNWWVAKIPFLCIDIDKDTINGILNYIEIYKKF